MANFKERKRKQRKVNKNIKYVNQKIKDDNLWKGRFQIKQIRDYYTPCPKQYDGSDWGPFYVTVEFIDKKTKKKQYILLYYLNDIHFINSLFVHLNSFIVAYCNVWKEKPSPYEQTEVYY